MLLSAPSSWNSRNPLSQKSLRKLKSHYFLRLRPRHYVPPIFSSFLEGQASLILVVLEVPQSWVWLAQLVLQENPKFRSAAVGP